MDWMSPFLLWLPLMSVSGSRGSSSSSFLSARAMSMPRVVPMSFCRLRWAAGLSPASVMALLI